MSLFLVCEGPDDERHLKAMIFSVLKESAEWLELEHLEFRGSESGSTYLRFAAVEAVHRQLFPNAFGMFAKGSFGGEPAAPYAPRARKVLQIFQKVSESPDDGFVMVCDEDMPGNHRIRGLRQAREQSPLRSRVVVGAPDPSVEAWVLCGFQPADADESNQLKKECRDLALDPTKEPQRLRSKSPGEPRHIKRVLACLCGNDPERESVSSSNLARIREFGHQCGAVAFLDDCKARLSPLFGARRAE